jgi:hypothetical protein
MVKGTESDASLKFKRIKRILNTRGRESDRERGHIHPNETSMLRKCRNRAARPIKNPLSPEIGGVWMYACMY